MPENSGHETNFVTKICQVCKCEASTLVRTMGRSLEGKTVTKKIETQRKHLEPDGQRCWDVLRTAFGGDHHLQKVYECGRGIEMSTFHSLATHDSNTLTRLVLLAHKFRCRVDIGASTPRTVRIMVHPRDDSGCCMSGHPGLNDLLNAVGKAMRDE